MPLNAQSMADMITKAYDVFKADMLKVDGGSNNENNNGSNNGSNGNSGNSGNQNGSSGEGSNGNGNSQSGSSNGDNQSQGGESGDTGGNGNNLSGTSNLPYVNPNCPVHGSKKVTKICPHCGHSKCGCKYHNPDPEPEKNYGITGNEITPENFDDLKKQNEEEGKNDKLPNGGNSDGSSGNDGGSGGDDNGNSSDGNNQGQGGLGGGGSADIFMIAFSKAIDLELQKATPTMTNVSIITAAGTLFISSRSSPVLYAIEIATKIMAYWSICILPIGIPVSGVITTVIPTNTAALIMPMAQEILKLGLSAANGDNFLPLCEVIVSYSQKVQYQVLELVPGTPPVTVPYMVQLT